MNVFLLVIHRDLTSKNPNPSPKELKKAFNLISSGFNIWLVQTN